MRTLSFVCMGAVAILGCGGNVATGSGGSTTTSSTSGSSGSTSTGGSTTTSSSTTSSGTTSSSATSSSTSSGGSCDPTKCTMPGFGCCNGACVNLKNDIDNCGTCGKKCAGDHPYCDMGTCGTPPCSGATCAAPEFCCGTQCCAAGMLCCDVPGPVVGPPQCQAPNAMGTCDQGCSGCVCASPDTPIATPLGERPIADLAVGDLVYSVENEAVVAVPILRVNRVPVHDHHVVRVRLATGTVLEISPRHPTADGRTFGDLRTGGTLDGKTIVSAELVPYGHPFTYDILPASSTHTYFAGGALIGTTLPDSGSEPRR